MSRKEIEKAYDAAIKNFVIVFLLIMLSVLAFITTVRAEPFRLNFENDWFSPGGQDRWLTNAFDIHYGEWGIGNEMYTPLDKKSPEIPYGDRPWDGYSYLEHESIEKVAFGEENVFIKRIGALGHASGTDRLQQWVHDDLGLGAHPTWAGQNPSQVAVDMIYFRRNREYLQSVIGDSRMTTLYGARVGNVVDEVFLDQELTKHFFKHMYVFGGVRASTVAFNTHLDGRLFDDNTYTIDKNWFVAEGRLGLDFRYDNWFVGYTWTYLTEEFKGQDGRHLMGNVHFGFNF